MGYESRIEQFKKELHGKRIRTTKAIGVFVVGDAQLRCPVLTGRLRASIDHVADSEKVVIGSNVEYALAVEKGINRRTAKPYLTPAVENNIGRIKDIVREHMR